MMAMCWFQSMGNSSPVPATSLEQSENMHKGACLDAILELGVENAIAHFKMPLPSSKYNGMTLQASGSLRKRIEN